MRSNSFLLSYNFFTAGTVYSFRAMTGKMFRNAVKPPAPSVLVWNMGRLLSDKLGSPWLISVMFGFLDVCWKLLSTSIC